MTLPNVWGAGAIFAYSGIYGTCTLKDSMCGQLMGDGIGVDFDAHALQLLLRLRSVREWTFEVVASDVIHGFVNGTEPFTILFAEQNVVVGYCPDALMIPVCHGDLLERRVGNGVELLIGRSVAYALAREMREGKIFFALVRDVRAAEAERRALHAVTTLDMDGLLMQKTAFFHSLPMPQGLSEVACKTMQKCYSVMKSQVYSAEGKFHHRWTTPDRVPHRYLWLWDSVFHSLGNGYIDPDLAKDTLLSVLDVQREDGFIPHMALPDRVSEVTQPPILAWGFWRLYERTGDSKLLFSVWKSLKAYLAWNMDHRDVNQNGLFEWFVDPKDPNCRCGESGMDNSPRFDGVKSMDCVDFSCFMANEMRHMQKIAHILGQSEDETEYAMQYQRIKDAIETQLYDETDGRYYDRELQSGKFKKVCAVSGFLPLFAGVCSEERAVCLVKDLFSPETFGTEVGVPSVAVCDSTFGSDMWRGPVWVNYNYMILCGLKEYGYEQEAARLRADTLQMIERWYEREGCIYEFYDCRNDRSPTWLPRKGMPLRPTDAYVRYPSIRDYGWSAALYVALREE